MWVQGFGSVPGMPGTQWQPNQHWFGELYRSSSRPGSKGKSVSLTSTHLMEAPLKGSLPASPRTFFKIQMSSLQPRLPGQNLWGRGPESLHF